MPALNGIHYSDALLSALFAGSFLFMGWSFHKFNKLDRSISSLELKLVTLFDKANRKGAKRVEKRFKELVTQLREKQT